MKQKDLIFWIWLAEALGAANRYFRTLITAYENPYEIFLAEEGEIERIPEISNRTKTALANKSLQRATEILDQCEKLSIGILPYDDKAYPQILREIPCPPVLLYYRGTLPEFDRGLSIGMVGTRRMSAYGMRSAYTIAYDLASKGVRIVSGMASGIDGVCAAAALAANGQTVAILGCGIDVVYPPHHKKLMNKIAEGGVLLSEYPPGARPYQSHFPVRNRLISGFSSGIVVVEAGLSSGSLITAKDAVLQGRDVFAVPASAGIRGAEGTNGLLRDGARLAVNADDILEPYQFIFSPNLNPQTQKQRSADFRDGMRYLADMGVIEMTEKTENSEKTKKNEATAASARSASPQPPTKRTAKTVRAEEGTVAVNGAKRNEPKPTPPTEQKAQRKTPDQTISSLSSVQLAVLQAMPDDRAVTADALSGIGFPYGDVIAALTMLEILGLIQKLPGALYTKT